MPSFAKELRTGALLRTKLGEVYLYLGKYEGVPLSLYDHYPEQGHLYLYTEDADTPEEAKHIDVKGHIRVRAMDRYINGNACYTKNLKQFESFLGYAECFTKADLPDHIWGLSRQAPKQ